MQLLKCNSLLYYTEGFLEYRCATNHEIFWAGAGMINFVLDVF